MSTSVLYRAIGLSGYVHLSVWDEMGEFKLRARLKESDFRCPNCGSRNVIRRGWVIRKVYAPPIGMRRTVLFIQTPRLGCRECQCVKTMSLPKVVPRCNHTKSFARMVVDLRKMMTIQDIARFLGVSQQMVRDIDKRYLKSRFRKPKLKQVKVIAIDEISLRKGHTYVTIVMDLESGAIIFIGEGEKAFSS